MAAFTNNLLVVTSTDVIGFGATLNAYGTVTAITGATMRYVTAAPTQVDNGGSLALRSNGSLYATAGGGVWVLIGGVASGWNLPNDVSGIWGTTAPLQVSSVYVSASNRWDLQGGNTTDLQASVEYRIRTGTSTAAGAVVGGGSGPIALTTGATDSTNAGGTGGASGLISFTTGNATSTAGTSGATGAINFTTGTSEDGNSGSIVMTIGTAGGTAGTIQAIGRLTTTDGVPAGTVKVVGGRSFASVTDSTAFVQSNVPGTFDVNFSIPANTLKAGSLLRIRAVARVTVAINGANATTVNLRVGTTTFGTAISGNASAVGVRCAIDCWLVARGAPGGGVAISGVGTGSWSDNVAVTSIAPGAGAAVPSLATNGALTVDATCVCAAAGDGSGRVVLEQLVVEVV